MKWIAGLVILAVAAAAILPTLAESEPSEQDVKALSAAIATAGCVLDSHNEKAVLLSSGLPEPVAEKAVRALLNTKRAVPLGTAAVKLVSGRCG